MDWDHGVDGGGGKWCLWVGQGIWGRWGPQGRPGNWRRGGDSGVCRGAKGDRQRPQEGCWGGLVRSRGLIGSIGGDVEFSPPPPPGLEAIFSPLISPTPK